MKLQKRLTSCLIAIIFGMTTTSASAGLLTLDGGWQTFSFADAGSSWSESFTFTIEDDAWLAVTDAFLSGDQFEFFADGISFGLTSNPTSFNEQISGDYDAAFADSGWSSAEIMFSAGTYEITGLTVLSPFGSGGAAIQLSSTSLGGPSFEQPSVAVPAPQMGLLMLAGFIGWAASRRRNI